MKLTALKRFELYKKHPEKHPYYKLRAFGFVSKPQKRMYEIIKNKYSDAILNYPIFTSTGWRFIDVAVPSKKIAFEFDGIYWHKGKEQQDIIRANSIKQLGWIIYSFNELTINTIKDII